ncbi:DUF927 domain-containing protein [Neobacillus niacini]|uniref:DUF927 domain-containing protein n=1 Tax=Neobacillus niacini TaxID=86668 RepID=UPI003983AE25
MKGRILGHSPPIPEKGKKEGENSTMKKIKVEKENLITIFRPNSKIVGVFHSVNDELKMELKNEMVTICRQVPVIARRFDNVETGKLFYELHWKEDSTEKTIVVPAIAIAKKSDLINLAEDGLAVNENNCKALIKFFDRYIAEIKPKSYKMSTRIGHVKGVFIHPNLTSDISIVPDNEGTRQILDSFREKGTVESWRDEILEKVRPFPVILFMILSSFASVLVYRFGTDPFIVDLSGPTSKGKTTALYIASTVWGNKDAIGQWNDTPVNIERKAEFLNSFPLILDDTKKAVTANPKMFEQMIYFFSGGQTKGRGKLHGFQANRTWKNILLSTGESSILSYSEGGGAAGRVVTIEESPFMDNPDTELLTELYKSIDKHHGVVGKEFIHRLTEMDEAEQEHLERMYNDKRLEYNKLNTEGNEVITRITAYFSLIFIAGGLVNKFFNFNLELDFIDGFFKKNLKENAALDKPKQHLDALLEELDSNRGVIYYEIRPSVIFAIEQNGSILLTPRFISDRLGAEANAIKKEWKRKGYIIPGRNDEIAPTITKNGNSFRGIMVNPEIVKELGYDFRQKQ